ncbi:MAG: ABC transporter ATP-binding protein [Patescibacteria group bacterium]|jgi:putative ABC transport system ATP-binding protein
MENNIITQQTAGAEPDKKNQPIITIEDLNVIYFMGKANEFYALKNISLEIYSGEFIIFFGPSGCGKSTLLYSIAGLETNILGNILVNGQNIAKMEHWEIEEYHRKKIGMIFQAYYLIGSLNVLNNVILPRIFVGVAHKDRKKKAMELLEHFGVKEQANKLPTELSGGQQQRVAICRSLMNEPDILLADEPLGNLDSNSANEVMMLLSDLNERLKKTIILVTHNPDYLRFAHRVFYLKDGMIIDRKTNKVIDRTIKKLVEIEEAAQPEISRSLSLLLRAYSSLSSAQAGNLLIPFKAKQIVLESMLGSSSDELEKISKKVEGLIMRGVNDNDEVLNFLDADTEKGGLGLDKRTAAKLTDGIKEIIKEIKFLQDEEAKNKKHNLVDSSAEIVRIRQYLMNIFKIDITSLEVLRNFDKAIGDRLNDSIDQIGFQKQLDAPIDKGGAGFDRRISKKMSKRMELLILGKFK